MVVIRLLLGEQLEEQPDHLCIRLGASRLPHIEPAEQLVGRQLRQERQASRLRLVDVAERAGVSPQYLSEVERGLKDPSSELLAAVSGALGLPVRELAVRTLRQGQPTGPVCLAA